MRISKLALTAAAIAGTLAAEAPAASQSARVPAPVLQTATLDIASAFHQHYRAMIEPLVFGRFAIGLSGEYTTQPEASGYDVTMFAVDCAADVRCGGVTSFDGSGYRAWSFNLHARWYPGALSFSGQRQSVSVYLGEFIGFHERRTNQQIYYGCYGCVTEPPRTDSSIVVQPQPYPYPDPYPGGSSSFWQVVRGWEPGAEFGVRVLPMRHVVLDVGGRVRLARLEDYQSGTRPGGIDTRLVVAIGVGW
jgi:hypothetical protein